MIYGNHVIYATEKVHNLWQPCINMVFHIHLIISLANMASHVSIFFSDVIVVVVVVVASITLFFLVFLEQQR